MITSTLNIHPNYFGDLAVEIIGDLINARIIEGCTLEVFDRAMAIVEKRFKHQHFLHNDSTFTESEGSNVRMDISGTLDSADCDVYEAAYEAAKLRM